MAWGYSMPRIAKSIECDNDTLKTLNKISRSRTEEARMVTRAKIILACISGEFISTTANKYELQPSTVIKWRERFIKQGLPGLRDEARTGKPKTYNKEFEKAIIQLLETKPPDGLAKWDGAVIAKRLNTSPDAVWRFLRKQGICLSRQRTWCISTDPYFAPKAADIIGLYLNPPYKALVLAIDEKPTIQALERQTGYVQTRNKKIVQGIQSTYKRNGTVNLFAALEVASGIVHGKVTQEKKRVDFLSFLDDVIKGYKPDQEIHVIVDNHSIHKKIDTWLDEHKNITVHYTPTSASWLNMVEIWFGIFTRKVLKGASFCSTDELKDKIMKYIGAYREDAHPFIWKKREVTGSQLKNTISNLCN